MKRPRKALKWLDWLSYDEPLATRLMEYITELEERAKSAEAYAAKHADMYIEEQNRRAKEEAGR